MQDKKILLDFMADAIARELKRIIAHRRFQAGTRQAKQERKAKGIMRKEKLERLPYLRGFGGRI